jgi:hypothetical protein
VDNSACRTSRGGGRKIIVKREAFKNSLRDGKKIHSTERVKCFPPGREVRSCCLLKVKVHHCHESSEFVGDIQLI